MIQRLLVANRGEIARRVFRTCRDLGIETVAVHSDADAGMPFVRDADAAVRLPGSTPAETYLRGDLVIAAAQRAGADAIHPGYGFLSENAAFARQVVAAGLTWVGPDPESIERMGSKIESKKLMEAAGVPVLGNFTADTASADDLPLLVKASAGGGGRGMRIVRALDALAGEIETAQSEAESAFGDGTVFVEPYVESGRHIEVQVLGTPTGTIVLGERDCSVQRRHQKVIEEAPAPALPEATRAALHAAAKAAAEAIDYRGAGTVEFLYDPAKDRFYFLEMNTRLQVEHPVTEAVYGVDLVALQIAVAEGGLDGRERRVEVGEPNGHAVEVRLYAEDPAHDYQPQSGRITAFDIPGVVSAFEGPASYGVRLDSGVGAGDEIGTHYDAMIAKVIVHAPTRAEALRRLAGVLAKARLHGLVTNRDLLVNLLRDPVLVDARMHTTWLDTADLAALAAAPGGEGTAQLSAFAAAVALAERARLAGPVQTRIPAGWRNVVAAPQVTTFAHGDEELAVRWYGGRTFRSADLESVTVVEAGPEAVTIDVDGVVRVFRVFADGDRVDVESSLGHVALRRVPRFVDPSTQVAAGSLLAPMPGSVIGVRAAVGDVVEEGQPILVMEAMKMQHTIAAPYAGTVTELSASAGQQVEAGAVLAVVQPHDSEEDFMTQTMFTEPEERVALREAVKKLASKYGREYVEKQAREGGKMTEMWLEMGRNGFLGVNIAEEYGGGGGGMADLAAVLEESAAAGAPLLMMVVSPAICGSIISRCGTEEQKRRWLPSIADGTHLMAFGITEADAGSNSHQITTTATRDGDEWVLKGQKTFISGVDEAQSVLIVSRTEDAKTGKLKPALFVVPTDAAGFTKQPIPMSWQAPEKQFTLFLDDVRLPADALVGDEDGGLWQLFAGLNPERIMGGAFSCGIARYALDKAVAYAKERSVWKDQPIGAHQGIAHPLAKVKIELEQARLLWQKAAALYDAGDDFTAGEYANMAKYTGGEVACNATDVAVHTHGGNGLTQEYGLGNMLVAARLGRIAPVSREMILNFVAMHSLGLPKSY